MLQKFSLITVLLLAVILRSLFINYLPPSLNWDEVSIGYNAKSVLTTGRDEWGVPFPNLFRAFGDYKLPAYIYASAPTIKLFGTTELGVRLPSIIAGSLMVLVSYVLTLRVSKNRSVALLVSLLVCLEPWTFFLSRIGLEANLAALFITLGITLLLSKKKASGIFFLGLSVWTYNSARIFVPIFLLVYLFTYRKTIRDNLSKSQIYLCTLFLFIFIVPMLVQLLSPTGQARAKWLSIIDSGAINQIESARNSSQLPKNIIRFVYNKPVYYLTTVSKNYLLSLSPGFLFINGGSHYQFSVPGFGLLYLIDLPFFLLGLLWSFRKAINNPSFKLVIYWFFLSPLAGSLVKDAPHPLRMITVLPLPMLFTGIGVFCLFNILKSKSLVLLYPLFLLPFIYIYAQNLPVYRTQYSWAWQYGYRELVDYAKSNYSDYNQIVITKYAAEPHEFVLFYWPWDAQSYITDSNLHRYAKSDWYWVDSFAKFKFVNDWEMPSYVASLPSNSQTLIFANPANLPQAESLGTINYLNDKPAFIIMKK